MDTLSIAVIAIVVIIFLGLVAFKLYSNIKLKGLRQTAIDLIVYAEEAFDKGMNNEKFQMVVQGIMQHISMFIVRTGQLIIMSIMGLHLLD